MDARSPQSEFVGLIFWMRSRTSRNTSGLPGLLCLLLKFQYQRTSGDARRSRSGLTMARTQGALPRPDQRAFGNYRNPRRALRTRFTVWLTSFVGTTSAVSFIPPHRPDITLPTC